MSFIAGYKATLKGRDVEEEIDYYVHRPLGYALAKMLYHTPVSADAVTVGSVILGATATVCVLWPFAFHLQVAGLLIFLSAVFDCADGQLARMRGTSSAIGRMLDGTVDSLVMMCVLPSLGYLLWQSHNDDPWLGGTLIALLVITVATSSFHTSSYDHYKNLYLFYTVPNHHDAEDVEQATERRSRSQATTLWQHVSWILYMQYVVTQRQVLREFDPHTPLSYRDLPSYDPERAEIYRKHNFALMRLWRGQFGFGSLVFGLALCTAVKQPEIYLFYRLIFLNGMYYLYLRPRQREASRRTWQEVRAWEKEHA